MATLTETLANLRETSANMNEFSRLVREKPSLLIRSTGPGQDGEAGHTRLQESSPV